MQWNIKIHKFCEAVPLIELNNINANDHASPYYYFSRCLSITMGGGKGGWGGVRPVSREGINSYKVYYIIS